MGMNDDIGVQMIEEADAVEIAHHSLVPAEKMETYRLGAELELIEEGQEPDRGIDDQLAFRRKMDRHAREAGIVRIAAATQRIFKLGSIHPAIRQTDYAFHFRLRSPKLRRLA